ncbi:MAG TPA: ABC transporter permease, partial [Cyclobacteriaceae bacterium]|nr:ABC transporter permease [Cyclobacteriaceae bacterium]
PGVRKVAVSSRVPGEWKHIPEIYVQAPETAAQGIDSIRTYFMGFDESMLDTYGLTMAEGKYFPANGLADSTTVLLNESAVKVLGLTDPVGEQLRILNDGKVMDMKVIGVVRDFHFRPLNYQIGPIAFRYDPESITMASIAYSGDPKLLGNKISQVWSKLDPVHPVDMMSMSDEIDKAYADSGFTDVVTILGYIAFLAISLACLGMLGMAMYTTQTRIKEIGLRKALGASVSSVVLLLSRSFLVLIGMGILVGAPIAYFLGDLFLGNYAYRINITPWMMFSGIFLLIVLGGVTIASQTLAAASRSPVKSLRYE